MSLPGRLARQIARVAVIRFQYQEIGDEFAEHVGRINVVPAMAMMDAAMERGCTALDGGDISEMLAAYQQLEEFTI